MLPQTKGKIFLADERGHHEMEWYRSYSTFNFGNYYSPHKTAFEALYVCNDDTLAGGQKITMQVDEPTDILLIPIVGAVKLKCSWAKPQLVEAGELLLTSLQAGSTFEIANPYADELVNFLQIWIKNPRNAFAESYERYSFDLHNKKNQLLDLLNPFAIIPAAKPYKVLMGKFDGRNEAAYAKANAANALFAFAIQGELEVQYRLLHARDGLALWEVDELELEALSNEAIILILEIPSVSGELVSSE